MTRPDHKIVRDELSEHLSRLWRFGLVLSGNRDVAEDLVQATCVRALEKSHQFQPGTRLDRWLFSILNSIWKNQLRREKVRRGHGLVDAEEVLVYDGGRHVETNILARQVLSEVQALPEAQREVVRLRFYDGKPFKEIAIMQGVSINTALARAHQAMKHLRTALEEHGDFGT